jgi:hypothetical protein
MAEIPLSEATIQQILVDEVGDTANLDLANAVQLFWTSFQDKQAIHPRLQELYTHRRLIDYALALVRNHVSFSTDGALNLQLAQRTAYLKDRKAEIQTDINKLETIARANRTPVIGQLTNTEVETPPPGVPYGDSHRIIGSPYFPEPDPEGNSF